MSSTAPAVTQPATENSPVAPAWHAVLTLVIILGLTWLGTRSSSQMRAVQDPQRLLLYGRTILTEWLLLAFVIWGLRLRGTSVSAVLGPSWKSLSVFFRDVALAAGFWVVAVVVISALRSLLHPLGIAKSVAFLLPQTPAEKFIWVLLSLTAGICEEAVHRGYLQKQFAAATRSLFAGILLSAVVFGLVHIYQGLTGAILNGVQGAMLGSLAAWRRSVRPGMLAHAWSDSFAGVLAKMLRVTVS